MLGANSADLLAAVERHLPAALAAGRARQALASAAAGIPDVFPTSLWLECRLAPGDGRVDLALRIPPEAVACLAEGPAPSDPRLERVRELARRWSRPGSALSRAAAGVWLEYDLPAPGTTPVPCVFVHLAGAAAEVDRDAAVDEAVEALLGGAPSAALSARLRACRAAAAHDARLLQVGVMLARDAASVRLCHLFHGAGRLPGLLARTGWDAGGDAAGPLGAAEAAVSRFEGTLMLHLDVGAGGVHPRFGVDLRMEQRPRLRGGADERPLLNALTAAGLADPSKTQALSTWPGARKVRLPGAPPRVLLRRLSHLKLSCSPAVAPEAKAYLAISATPLAPSAEAPELRRRTRT